MCLCALLTHCQALTGLLVALRERREIPGANFSQNLQHNTPVSFCPDENKSLYKALFLMHVLKLASPLHWCAGQSAAGPAGRAEHLPSAARGGAGGHISGSNAERPAHTATTQCRSLPRWSTVHRAWEHKKKKTCKNTRKVWKLSKPMLNLKALVQLLQHLKSRMQQSQVT